MKRILRSKTAWALVAIMAASVWALTRSGSAPQTKTIIGKVERGDLVQRVTIAGTVAPNRRTVISAPYNGYVRKIFVTMGQKLKAGDPVVSVAPSLTGNLDEVYPMRVPFAGTVVQILKTEGEYVDQNNREMNQLVRIDDLDKLFVDAISPEIEVGKIKVGQEVQIKAAAILDRSYAGSIKHISLAAKEQNQWEKSRIEFPVTVEVTDPDGRLMPGMSVVIDVIANKKTGVLTLKHEFVNRDGEDYFVVRKSGEKRPIKVGLRNEESFEILEGLAEKDEVKSIDFLATSEIAK